MTSYVGPQTISLRNSRPNNKIRSIELPMDVLPLIAIDPGGTLGFSILVLPRRFTDLDILDVDFEVALRRKVMWQHGEIYTRRDENQAMYVVGKMLEEWPSAAVVLESFVLRPQRREKGEEMISPVRQIAVIKHHLWRWGRMCFEQDASFKATMNDDRLHALNVYQRVGGLEHARDADRHALMFLRRIISGTVDRTTVWPHIYQKAEFDVS